MAPAKQGLLQCQQPDELSRTCLSLSKVYQTGPSTWIYEMNTAINGIVLSMKTETFERGAELCDVIDLNDLTAATYTEYGRPASASQVAEVKAIFRDQMRPFSGKTVCTRIVPGHEASGTDVMQATVNAKRFPAGDYAVKWVSPRDGWRVAP
jgi:hypothetical protein